MTPYWTRSLRPTWHKASFCQGGECVEISKQDDQIVLRNSRRPRRVVRYTPQEWDAFTAGLRARGI